MLPFTRGGPRRPLIIGEVALAHDGSLGLAHAFVDAIADAGADAVKFQTHCAAEESTKHEPWRVRFSPQDETRFDYWVRTAFTEAQWQGLSRHAAARGLLFISSAFSVAAIDLLDRAGVAAWKLASGTLDDPRLLERLAGDRRTVLVSTGMSPLEEIDDAVARLRVRGTPVAVLQCTSQYPCPPEGVGLNLLDVFRQRYGCPVGLSDHSGTIFPSLAAATLGADVLEVHVTLSREMFGPDVPASVTTAELRQIVEGTRFIARMLASPVDKDAQATALEPMRGIFGKSLVSAEPLPAGLVLEARHVAFRKAGKGLPPNRLPSLVGRRLRRAVPAHEPLADTDFEEA
ncbi:MAG TPA: N-acetylneuraminate synthase family protein [Vicinamibacterales bacterium]